jgi:tetratricopeptide (TPR) repeat protein
MSPWTLTSIMWVVYGGETNVDQPRRGCETWAVKQKDLISMNGISANRIAHLLWISAVVSFVVLHCNDAAAQGDPFNSMTSRTTLTPGYYSNGGTPVIVKVYTGKDLRLDRQAIVKLSNESTHYESTQTTDGNSESAFLGLQFGHYALDVSAVGYLTVHKEFQLSTQNSTYSELVILERDPAAINFKDPDATMPSKARKETKRGVSALKSGNLNAAQKWLDAAYKTAPSNSDLNFLLGYLFYQKKDYTHAQAFLGNATDLNPHDAQALTLLGRLGLQQGDYGAASNALRRAIQADSDYWIAHHFLADAYLKQREYDKAREQAVLALGDGNIKGNPAKLVLGQALVNLGQEKQGIEVLKGFIEDSPKNPIVPQVKELISAVESRSRSVPAPLNTGPRTTASIIGIDSLLAAPEPTFSVKPWQPPGIDDVKPLVAQDVMCPYDAVIQGSGKSMVQLVEDVSRISAIEHLLHSRLDEMGNPLTKDTRQFNYVASFTESTPGSVAVDEYRAEHLGIADFPDQIASSGFATLGLVFHPLMRDNFEMICEGQGDWRGQAAWLVHFRQRDDKPAHIHDYRVGSQVYALKLKGRAWISADKFRILRIESELATPVPQIHLASEHQIVEYGPVPFPKRNMQLWLPQSAEIYLDFRRHRYYRKHSFDHYMLFSVDADEKRKEPKEQPAESQPRPN